jgi:hypothetical protein
VRRRIAATLDLVLVLLAVLTVSIILFGGVRVFAGTFRASATSEVRILAAFGVCLLLRLALAPRPSLRDRAQAAASWVRARRGPAAAPLAWIWLTTRIGVLVLGFIATATIGAPPKEALLRVSDNPLLDLPFRWDTGWYLAIAVDGYRWDPDAPRLEQQRVAFYPAYPFLMRVAGALIGARSDPSPVTPRRIERVRTRTLLAGWLLALAASYASLGALFTWASAAVGRRTALTAVALLSCYPFAVYYSAAYPEALFLLAMLSAYNAVLSDRAAPAGAWGLFAGLLRPNGFLIALPLLLVARQRRARPRMWVAAAMPVAGMAIYSASMWIMTGQPLVWMAAHAAWGRTPLTWQSSVSQPLDRIITDGPLNFAVTAPYHIMHGTALIFALAMLPAVWRRLGAAPALLVVVMILPPLLAGGLMSMGRLTSTLFPIFVALAAVVPRRYVGTWLMLFALGQGLVAVLFFTWRPLV